MTPSTDNQKIEEIRRSAQMSYDDLLCLIADQVEGLDPELLYQAPAQGEWTIMESLAHIIEFLPYWANEIEKLVAVPGQPFGRTMQHEGRLHAISEHSHDSLEQARAALPASYARLEQVLSGLKDSDLELTGMHSRFGEKSLDWFINDFVTQHLVDHVGQLKVALTEVVSHA